MSWYQPRITFRHPTTTGQSNRDIRFYIKPKPEDYYSIHTFTEAVGKDVRTDEVFSAIEASTAAAETQQQQ